MVGRANSGRGRGTTIGRPPRSTVGSSSSAGRGNPNADAFMDDSEFVAAAPGLDQFQVVDDMGTTPSPGSQSRVRGTGISLEMPPRHPSQRPTIELIDGGFKDPTVGRVAAKILKTMFAGPWAHYEDIPHEHFLLMLDRFRFFYNWPADMDTDILYAFRLDVKNKYPDMMHEARKRAARRLLDIDGITWDGHDYTMLSAHNPKFIPNEYWLQMIDRVWNNDAFRRTCTVNTTNRKTEYQGMTSRHVGGSIRTAQHRDRMTQQWGRQPTTSEVYERMHCSNRKHVPGATGPPTDPPIYIYPKAAEYANNYRQIREQEYPDLPSDAIPPNDAELWERSVGGRHKGRIFGFGSS
ncbi:hypothetical protein OSB04_020623 [Centaurea solstitialis]|uniref:Uncharacterized protein n=1 Tax=Centaurea solstitialis TaxID=347529 RepID=A0AA38T4R1_9ASTR|nr:hypothetical protein OSB04_020623 [Centaurea solstitialis]